MKLTEIVDYPYHRKRYIEVANILLKDIQKIRDHYYLSGIVPKEKIISEFEMVFMLFINRYKKNEGYHPYNYEIASTIKQIYAIMAELQTIFTESKYS